MSRAHGTLYAEIISFTRVAREHLNQTDQDLSGRSWSWTVRHDAVVSIIVEFFAAPDDASGARVLQTGPRRAFESLSFGNFDPEEAVVEWECLFAGVRFEQLVEADEPRLVAGQGDDECVVFAISPRLSAALADAERAELKDAAVAWSFQRAEDGEVIDPEIAEVILSDLAAFVSSARRQGRNVYCWVA
ncbi:hypothetical protein OOK27_50705 [Streptomyces canus]|uniref:hypothetical protein n=1 Tax=Streptomyces canus TaxID=58343 RepID=UPI002258C908|nr:hypothetical protein [Streptomyces canus]MCX5262296.1 hypothetical protein [Streptomyces canus]